MKTIKLNEKKIEAGKKALEEDLARKYTQPLAPHVEELFQAMGFASTAWDKDGVFMAQDVERRANDVIGAFERYVDANFVHRTAMSSEYIPIVEHEIKIKQFLEQGVSINYETLKAEDFALMIFAWACKKKGMLAEQFYKILPNFTNGKRVKQLNADARILRRENSAIVTFEGDMVITEITEGEKQLTRAMR